MRITNIDTLSALIDRLITENIKQFFFKKEGLDDKIEHQQNVIEKIKVKLIQLFQDTYRREKYEYVGEKRTFTANSIVENIEDLVTNDIHIGESDRQRLRLVTLEEKRLRKSNEHRSNNKNKIDENFKKFVEE